MQILGHGSYGEVAKAYDNVTKKHVAVKRMRNVFDQNTDAKRIFREIHLLRRLHHPHVIRLLDIICPNLDNPLTADALERPVKPSVARLGATGPHSYVGTSKDPLLSDSVSVAAADSPTAMSASTDEGDDEQDEGGPSKRMRVEGSNGSVGGGSVGSLNGRERGLGHQLSSVSTGSAMSEDDGASSADTTPALGGNGNVSGSNDSKESGGFAVPLGRTDSGGGDEPTSSGSGPAGGGSFRTPTETMSRRELSDVLSDLYMVFEFHDTDLYKLIVSAQFLTTPHVQTFVYQLLVGIKYVHSSNVVHRDLKPANILVNEDCSLKVRDDIPPAACLSSCPNLYSRRPVPLLTPSTCSAL
jgi:serine/threonine protein kinase